MDPKESWWWFPALLTSQTLKVEEKPPTMLPFLTLLPLALLHQASYKLEEIMYV